MLTKAIHNRRSERRFRTALVAAALAIALGFSMTDIDDAAAAGADRCQSQLDQLDRFLQRAKLTPEKGKPVLLKRSEAEAHRKAGRHDACVAAAREALALLGKTPQ